jgi:hypothetical protein
MLQYFPTKILYAFLICLIGVFLVFLPGLTKLIIFEKRTNCEAFYYVLMYTYVHYFSAIIIHVDIALK